MNPDKSSHSDKSRSPRQVSTPSPITHPAPMLVRFSDDRVARSPHSRRLKRPCQASPKRESPRWDECPRGAPHFLATNSPPAQTPTADYPRSTAPSTTAAFAAKLARNHRRRLRFERGCKILFIFREDDIARAWRWHARDSSRLPRCRRPQRARRSFPPAL